MTQRFPLITAHSGCMNTLDNTLFSVKAGLEIGADIIEEDVRVTKDGIPVLAHDDVLYTEDGRECRISQIAFEEIRELSFAVKHGEHHVTMRICTVEEMLPLVRDAGKIANLDLKVDESIEPAAALVHKYGMVDQVILSGCEKERAIKAQKTHPELRKLLNTDKDLFFSMEYSAAAEQTCRDAIEASAVGININYMLVRPELMECASRFGLPIYVWTVDDVILMEQFVRIGAASITSRNVEALVRLKQNMIE